MYSVQAVLIHKKRGMTKKKALTLVHSLGYKPIKDVHETKNYYRYRIADPKKFRGFITKKLNAIVSLVVGYTS